jgi:hypothetical protein
LTGGILGIIAPFVGYLLNKLEDKLFSNEIIGKMLF